MLVTLTPAEVVEGKYMSFDPLTNHFEWNPDGSCTVHPLQYWDEASYADYQGDSYTDRYQDE